MTQYTRITNEDLAANALYDKVNNIADSLNADKVDRAQLGLRKPNTAYKVNDLVYCEYHPNNLLVCTSAGVTSSSSLDTSSSLTDGGTINDGTLIWKVVTRITNRGDRTLYDATTLTGTLHSKDTSHAIGEANTWGNSIDFKDKNNARLGRIQPMMVDSETIKMGMYAENDKGITVDNKGRTSCPTPTEDTTTSTQIDTVGARNTKLSSYYNDFKAQLDNKIQEVSVLPANPTLGVLYVIPE